MRFTYLLIAALAIAVAACSTRHADTPIYSYAAQADSAYIKGSADATDGLLGGKAVEVAIYPSLVDGNTINYRTRFPNDARKVFDLSVPLAPGRHMIAAKFEAVGMQPSFLNISLAAQPGEVYTIKKIVQWDKGLLTDKVSSVTVWVEDSHGNKVVDMRTFGATTPTSTTTTTTMMPKVKGR